MRPMKRRGNRRYYQHHEVLMIRRIRELLYDQGFTISGARNKLQELVQTERERRRNDEEDAVDVVDFGEAVGADDEVADGPAAEMPFSIPASALIGMRRELLEIRELLSLQV